MSAHHLHHYFREAKSWSDDCFGKLEQTKNRYQLAFLASMGVNVAAMGVIMMLAEWQTVVPLLVHHYENGITTIKPLQEKHAPSNRAQVESDIFRYITHRESWDISSFRAQFNLVTLLSNNQVAKEYVAEQDKQNKLSPIQSLGEGIKREVHIYNINFLDSVLANEKDIHQDHQALAEVVLSLIDTDKNTGKVTEHHYNALISWQYTNPPTSPALRWLNWNGFEVTRYTRQVRVVG